MDVDKLLQLSRFLAEVAGQQPQNFLDVAGHVPQIGCGGTREACLGRLTASR